MASQTSNVCMSLPPEVLKLIASHLKPRHLYKLMRTSHTVRRVVDCEGYWERAAAHAVLRHLDSMEIEPGASQICRFDKRPGLFHLVNVDYHDSIDCVIARARQAFGDLGVAALVRAGEAVVLADPDNYRHLHASYSEEAGTMKEVVRRETRRVLDEQSSAGHKLRKFQRELDDDAALSRAAKRHVMGKFEALFEDVAHDEMVETELYKFWHMAQGFV